MHSHSVPNAPSLLLENVVAVAAPDRRAAAKEAGEHQARGARAEERALRRLLYEPCQRVERVILRALHRQRVRAAAVARVIDRVL